MSQARILLVDDDPHLREVLGYALRREGYTVFEAADGSEALRRFAEQPVDLVVLDVMMPELDGLGVCRELRRSSQVPIVFLSSKAEELDRVLGLELGGDDYVTKPFSPRELLSRVRAVLRRSQAPPLPPAQDAAEAAGSRLGLGPLRMDLEAHRCTVDGVELSLTLTEFRMLQTLLGAPGRAYSRDELVERSYEGRHFVSGRTVDSHVRRIRAKLREQGLDDVIETVHGLGFRLRKP
jgi:two-component system OmpR family response regulator